MSPFEYDPSDRYAEYYETLFQLMQRWDLQPKNSAIRKKSHGFPNP